MIVLSLRIAIMAALALTKAEGVLKDWSLSTSIVETADVLTTRELDSGDHPWMTGQAGHWRDTHDAAEAASYPAPAWTSWTNDYHSYPVYPAYPAPVPECPPGYETLPPPDYRSPPPLSRALAATGYGDAEYEVHMRPTHNARRRYR